MEIDMPKDARLYMTFPNDFHRHPKVARLPIEARWAFVEMNGEARLADNDGIFDAADAEFMWGSALQMLVNSHPTRPLVQRVGETYVIRDYAEHQQTRAEREALASKRSAAGQRGRAKQIESKPSSDVEVADHGNAIDAEFEQMWSMWPRKNDKQTARKRWSALSAAKRRDIAPKLAAHAKAHEQHTPTQFVPYLATWLNQQRWDDPLPTSRDDGARVAQRDQNAAVLARYASENGDHS